MNQTSLFSRFLSGTAFTTLLLASGVALYSGMPQQAVAQDLYWNAGGTFGDGSSLVAGAGTWATNAANWTSDPTNMTGSGENWPNGTGLNAIFTGLEQNYFSVTVDGTVDFDTITFDSSNSPPGVDDFNTLQFVGNGALRLAPGSGNAGTLHRITSVQQILEVSITNKADNSPTDLIIDGPGGANGVAWLTVLADLTYTGTTFLRTGLLDLGGYYPFETLYQNGSVAGDIVLSPSTRLSIWTASGNQTVTNTISSSD
ncbi:hypothetical protein GGR30_003147, partial [Martelella radicis]